MAKRKVKIPRRDFQTKADFQTFLDDEKEWMYNRIFEAIKLAHKSKGVEAQILEVGIEESMTVLTMNSFITDWEETLTLALKWYEKHEKYEKCSEVLNLITEVQNTTTSSI
jgi:hypothetical protein